MRPGEWPYSFSNVSRQQLKLSFESFDWRLTHEFELSCISLKYGFGGSDSSFNESLPWLRPCSCRTAHKLASITVSNCAQTSMNSMGNYRLKKTTENPAVMRTNVANFLSQNNVWLVLLLNLLLTTKIPTDWVHWLGCYSDKVPLISFHC